MFKVELFSLENFGNGKVEYASMASSLIHNQKKKKKL